MCVSSKFCRLTGVFALGLILAGCSVISAKSGSQSIKMLLGEHNLSHCQFLGKVTGSSPVNKITGEHPSYTNRLISARNDLRNEAFKLGGNTVHVGRVNNTGRYEIPGVDKKIIIDGKAYFCE
ncbi:MAG: DUF4156 domain-containing protein [Nitrosomonas sp.]|nr:DUF4156 domain-containing protein [Nitrosomonas sp.]